jgi:hypothetical protein
VRLAFAGLALLVAGCAVESEQIHESWFVCERDSQCKVLQDATCTLTPVNRRYARSLADWMARTHWDEVKTGRCPESIIRYYPECEDARCSSHAVLR